MQAREALEADFGNKLGSSVHLLGDLIDKTSSGKYTCNLHPLLVIPWKTSELRSLLLWLQTFGR